LHEQKSVEVFSFLCDIININPWITSPHLVSVLKMEMLVKVLEDHQVFKNQTNKKAQPNNKQVVSGQNLKIGMKKT